MRGGGFWSDWRNQGLLLIAENALMAGVAYHSGWHIVCGFLLGMVVMTAVVMAARNSVERGC